MIQVHELKTLAPYWDAVKRGEKNFEVRRDDRGFQKGDLVALQKIDKDGQFVIDYVSAGSPPKTIILRIDYILTGGQFGIEPGYVVLGLSEPHEAQP